MTGNGRPDWADDPLLDGLEVYRVGGAIRDELLGLNAREHDFVVVGATPDELHRRGFRPVGRDFPVFLHPKNNTEFALARTERKSAPGYRGFQFHTGPDVTLEQDLLRRDLTVNAIAEAPDGRRIDPLNGIADLKARVLRHISPAFSEDPVRLLRLARFATRLTDFSIAEETLRLCRQLVESGEVDALVPERVWQEMARAIMHPQPDRFFRTLRQTGALARILPELDALFGVPQNPKYHPEIDTGEHVMQVLNQSARLNASLETRYACLLHDLGKGVTPETEWPAHHRHEQAGLPGVHAVSDRLRVPKACKELALLVCEHHLNAHNALELRAATVVDLIQRLDGWRRGDRFEQFLLACKADRLGRQAAGQTRETDPHCPALDFLRHARKRTQSVPTDGLIAQGKTGLQLADAIRRQRIEQIRVLKRETIERSNH